MRENSIDPRQHTFVTADAFVYLESARSRGESWDLIISDPPSFAPNEKSRPRALSAYRKLHGACAAVLAPGGTFCASSCSSHVTAEDFAGDARRRRARSHRLIGGRDVRPPRDHPTLAAWPEGRYLKFVVMA